MDDSTNKAAGTPADAKNISELRAQIDEIDRELLRCFTERMKISGNIAAFKQANGLRIFDQSREHAKLKAVCDQLEAENPELKTYAVPLYSTIMALSRAYQRKLTVSEHKLTDKIERALNDSPRFLPEFSLVACQGVEGANSQIACEKLFQNPNIMYFSSFEAVFTAIEKGLCRYGVVPVENSTAGTVNSVYDLMMEHSFYIARSVRMKIDHDLLARPDAELSGIREIYSHPQAISQCSKFLAGLKNVKVIPCENTAVAAKIVAESGRNDIAALAAPSCVKYYDLKCLKPSAQDSDGNYTRFICICKDLEILPGAERTSLMVTLPHEAGSLYKLLSRFFALGINLLKLESRPLPGRDFEFMFYFDLETPVYSDKFTELIGELPGACEKFVYLGSYSEVV